MTIYTVKINNRNYTEYIFYEANQNNEISLDIKPSESKLFSNDLFL